MKKQKARGVSSTDGPRKVGKRLSQTQAYTATPATDQSPQRKSTRLSFRQSGQFRQPLNAEPDPTIEYFRPWDITRAVTVIPNRFLAYPHLSLAAKIVYWTMGRYSHGKTYVFAKATTIATALCLARTTVLQAQAELVERGFLRRTRRGQGKPNRYDFLAHPLFQELFSPTPDDDDLEVTEIPRKPPSGPTSGQKSEFPTSGSRESRPLEVRKTDHVSVVFSCSSEAGRQAPPPPALPACLPTDSTPRLADLRPVFRHDHISDQALIALDGLVRDQVGHEYAPADFVGFVRSRAKRGNCTTGLLFAPQGLVADYAAKMREADDEWASAIAKTVGVPHVTARQCEQWDLMTTTGPLTTDQLERYRQTEAEMRATLDDPKASPDDQRFARYLLGE